MRTVRTPDGAGLWCEVREPVSGDAPHGLPVLVIPGRTLDHRMWLPFLEALAPTRQVILVDPRGTGRSDDAFPSAWGTEGQGRDLALVVDAARAATGAEAVHVLGFSMGGRAAQWLAGDHADAVAALVLAGTAVHDPLGPRRDPAAEAALRSGDPRVMADAFFPADWVAGHHDLAHDVVRPRTHSRAATMAHARASARHDGRAACERITAPTLVVHGDDDPLTVSEHGRILSEHIAGARFLPVPGARHACWVGTQDLGATAIRDHLAAHD